MPDTSNSPATSPDVNASPATNPNEGVSNPPDGGAVTSVDTPQDQMQTPAPNQPQPQGPSAPSQGAQGGQQPQTQSDNSADQVRIPSKPLATAAVPDKDYSNHPAVQRAGVMNAIAETLAGGPRYKETIDANTGEMTRQRVPMSRADIGMAIAMEAISGALSGLTQKGPGATGRAAAAGFGQVEGQVQQAQQRQDAQAQADFTRHYQVLETNMRLYQNALTVGKMGREENEAYVGQFSDTANKLQNDHPEVVKGVVNYSDFGKYHVTMDSAIPYKVVPRLDPNTGEQVKVNGVPQSDIQYLIVDPSFQADNLLTDEDRAAAKKYKIPGLSASNLPQSFPMKLSMYLNYKSKLASLELADKDLQHYYESVNTPGQQSGQAPTQTPELKTPEWNDLADQGAKDAGISNALLRAVIHEEDGPEDPKAVNKKSGATGPAQFMPATAKRYGVSDPTDPKQAIPAAGKYISDLVKQYHGDIKTALAAYNGAANPTDPSSWKPETQKYVADITKAIGLQESQGSDKGAVEPVDLAKAIQQDPTLVNALQKFQPLLNATGDNMGNLHYQKALGELGQRDPQAAAKILQLYGGNEMLGKYEQQRTLEADKVKRTQDNQAAIEKYQTEQQFKQQMDQKAESDMQASLHPPEGFKLPQNLPAMDADSLEDNLRQQGVTVPEGFPALYAVAHYDAPLTTAAARIWAKGAPHEMDQQTMLSFIRRFINPSYKAGDYNIRNNAKKNMYDPAKVGAGKVIYDAGTASQHVQMFVDAGKALQNKDINALNRIAQIVGAQTGKDAPVVFNAIANAASDEVTKVLTGQAPYQEQVLSNRDLVKNDHSMKQIEGVARAWTTLMHARIRNMDEGAVKTFGEHLQNIGDGPTQLYRQYGLDTPWADSQGSDSPNTPNSSGNMNAFTPQPGNTKLYPKISQDGKRGLGPDGKVYDIATGKLIGQQQPQQPQQPQQQQPQQQQQAAVGRPI